MNQPILTPAQYADLHKAVTGSDGELASHVESLLINLYCIFVEDLPACDKCAAADDLRDDAVRISDYCEEVYRSVLA